MSLITISKKDFRHEFFFFNGSTKPPTPDPPPPRSHLPLNGQNPLSVTKVFLSMLGAWEKQKMFSKAILFALKMLIEIGPFPRGYFDHFLLAFIYSKTK